MTRVLIVEDSAGLRGALAAGLASAGLKVAHACERGEHAITALDRAALERAAVDVALVDLGLPGISGVETIKRIRARHPRVAVLVLSVFEDPATIVEAIEAGAQGFLLKGSGLEEVVRGIQDVIGGLAPVSPAVARHLLDVLRRRSATSSTRPLGEPLTDREREVLALLVEGKSYGAVAQLLGIGHGTVQTYVKSVYRKLEVSSKAEATLVAVRSGLVSR